MTHTHTSTDLAHEIAARAEQAGQQTTEYLASEHGRAVAAALAAQPHKPICETCDGDGLQPLPEDEPARRIPGLSGGAYTGPCEACGGTGHVACECGADATAYHWVIDGEDDDHARRLATCHQCHDDYQTQDRILHVAVRS
jgi:hypothetical protein